MRHRAAVVFGILLALAPRATAQPVEPSPIVESAPTAEPMPSPHLWLRAGAGELRVFSGKLFLIPLDSHVLTSDKWDELELEKKRLQEQEIRLTAENKSLGESADEVPWRIIALAAAVGLITGAYIGLKF
jgi:hypothetical protein